MMSKNNIDSLGFKSPAFRALIHGIREDFPLMEDDAVQLKGSNISLKISRLPKGKGKLKEFIAIVLCQLKAFGVMITNFEKEVSFDIDAEEIVFIIKKEEKDEVDDVQIDKRVDIIGAIMFNLSLIC